MCKSLLRGLVEKSLLQYNVTPTGTAYFSMLQMIRHYARARLVEQGQEAHLQAAHAAVYRRLVVESLPLMETGEAEHALNRLDQTHNNLRSALTWYLQADVAEGLQMATMLAAGLWGIRGYFSEGREWLEQFLAVISQNWEVEAQINQANGWIALVRMALGQGDLSAATTFAHNAERLAMSVEDNGLVRLALRCRASIFLHQSDYTQATQLYRQALELCGDDEPKEAASILNGLGLIAKDQGDTTTALAAHERSRALYAQLGDAIGLARTLTYASIAAYWQKAYDRCIELAQQAIQWQSGAGDVMSATYSQEVMGMALAKLGRISEGLETLEACVAAFRQMDDRSGIAMTLVDLGQVTYVLGEFEDALRYHREALAIAQEIGDRRRVAFCLEGIAMALTRLGAAEGAEKVETGASRGAEERPSVLEEAVRLFGAAEELRQTIGSPLPETDRQAYMACRRLALQRIAAKRPTPPHPPG